MQIKLTDKAKELEKKLNISFIAAPATLGSAGYDLRACIDEPVDIFPDEIYKFPTGLHIYLENPSLCALFLPRSSSPGLTLVNTVGLLDSDYYHEAFLKYKNTGDDVLIVQPGEKIGQFVIFNCLHPTLHIVDEIIHQSTRNGGFGSTGKY